MQKFLIIQTAFTGDVVLATCLIEKIHAFFPDAQIDFLLRKGNEGLLQQHPLLHEVLIWNKKAGKYKSLLQLLSIIRKKKYDRVINVQRFASTGFLTAFSGARERIGFDKNPFSWAFTKRVRHRMEAIHASPHEIERNLSLVNDFTDDSIYKPRLYPAQADYERVSGMKKQPYVCIAPASVWFTKQYPAEKWMDLIQQLPGHYTIYLLGAPGEAGLCSDIAQKSKNPNVVSLAGQLSFLQSAALMKDALLNYVNDSAPMHFASAMNAPVAAVYCSTIPSFGYGPLSDKSYIVETKETLDCRPCGLHGHKQCPLGHFKCAYTIRDEQLLSLIG
ncbi:MAG: glycosyltransferase family 9 protein [Chitinophagaceae bacterium]|nr:glycosyltransferase family 9 protein [Chitinophagaceae bacterium]